MATDCNSPYRTRRMVIARRALTAWVVFTAIVLFFLLNSGMLAPSAWWLFASVAGLAIGYAVIVSSVPRRLVFLTGVVLAIGSLALIVRMSDGFLFAGMDEAKDYAKRISGSVESYRRTTGHWPGSLSDLPKGSYDARSVAGFSIRYALTQDGEPYLSLSKGNLIEAFNWRTKTWITHWTND